MWWPLAEVALRSRKMATELTWVRRSGQAENRARVTAHWSAARHANNRPTARHPKYTASKFSWFGGELHLMMWIRRVLYPTPTAASGAFSCDDSRETEE